MTAIQFSCKRITWCASLDVDDRPSASSHIRTKPSPTATTRETPAPATLTPRGLLSRRSVPSFFPSLQNTALERHPSPGAIAIPSSELNAAEPADQDLPSALRPHVNSVMPSSMAFSETRTLPSGHSRSLNAAPRLSESKGIDENRPRNDDIFLNIARTDSGRRDSLGRSDFRRSRLGYSSGSLRSPTARDEEHTPSPDHRPSNFDSPLHSQNASTLSYNPAPHAPASAHPLDDSSRFRYSSLSGARSTIGAPRSRLSRTSPETSPRSPAVNRDLEPRERRASLHESRLHRNSGLSTVRSSRQPSASEATERAPDDVEKSRAEESGSNLSTTAPSTVWDQLDDLKSRIRKLELTGKLPPSSQAAISGANERPRTAATTMTTLSTSPRHYRKASSPSMEENPVQNQVHPILQSALAKAKMVLSNDVYAALEVTITDALALSTTLGANTAPSGSVSVVNGGYSSPERHARRKADSVCRSLTELCIALTDGELKRRRPSSSQGTASQPQRANGSEAEPSRPTSSYRAASHEPESVERRPSTNRISSRLEARRASVANPSPGSINESKPAQSPNLTTPPSRLHRISTSLRSRRVPTEDAAVETPNSSRSLTRAMTEVATPSPAQSVSPRQRFSYGHSVNRSGSGVQQEQGLGLTPRSPQYPPSTPQAPASQPRTPSTLSQSGIPTHTGIPSQSGIPFRRSYMTPGVYSPATSRSNIQAGSRRYGLSPGIEENPRPSQLEPSQTRISGPSGKSVTSYTPIQQPRLRTNSLGSRKFALRRRSAVMPDDPVNLDDSID
ncbi:uncharacterized protein N7484_000609 [Penicillium longicatenatum]|uniref:uncharacterized protein n=1 Tax=Penicillium longicatenatum TaxID=1561947 RepID=UPI0025482D26|nr:uncharacterized protein N7484_000609 [Penicillium longicatenatum]KAJ5661237.1 hypothetical protein N7484_000609 [Penicillium longicatenatum]